MLGVNCLSGHKFNRMPESIKRAADMVAYVKKKGYGGGFWYIGNEEAHLHGGVVEYAKVFKVHAEAMKKIDPKIKIFWNQNSANEKSIKLFLANDGGTSDGLETHGKWPYGGEANSLKPGTFKQWQLEVPLVDRKYHNRAWRTIADEYRNVAAKQGRKNYLIVNNEYGIAKEENIKGFNRYGYGILMTDYLQELFIGNWDMSCFWDMSRQDENGLLSSKKNGYRMNPFHIGMGLLADAQGGQMLEVKTGNKYVYGFASLKEGKVLLYLINKSKKEQTLDISLTKGKVFKVSGEIMQDTADHWGELKKLSVKKGKTYNASMPPLTFCQISFEVNMK